MDYSRANWSGDFMYSEIIGQPYEIEDDFAVGLYTVRDFPEINMHINIETGKIMEVWLDKEGGDE